MSRWTRETCLAAIRAYYARHGTPPATDAFTHAASHGLPSRTTCMRQLGTWHIEEMWEQAGVAFADPVDRNYPWTDCQCQDCGVPLRERLSGQEEIPILCAACCLHRAAVVKAARPAVEESEDTADMLCEHSRDAAQKGAAMDAPDHITTKQVAQLLGITIGTVVKKVAAGTLPVAGVSRTNGYLFRLTDVLRYQARRVQGHYGAVQAP